MLRPLARRAHAVACGLRASGAAVAPLLPLAAAAKSSRAGGSSPARRRGQPAAARRRGSDSGRGRGDWIRSADEWEEAELERSRKRGRRAADVDDGDADASLTPALRQLADLRHPHTWYYRARALRRTVHLHVGPTNAGKTHAALTALRSARSGVYCGPLRLLAWELYERLNEGGTPCDLLTGQEREVVHGSRHVSCTVEMVDVDTTPVDVAVVDEIQMIGDPERGWAWTRALLGVAADEVHACGDPSAVPLVEALLALTGDRLVVHTYARLSPLVVAPKPLASLGDVLRGDCVVAFSRRELFAVKKEVESQTGLRAGVIYGALPPSVRRQQATRFNRHTQQQQPQQQAGAVASGRVGEAAAPAPPPPPPSPLDDSDGADDGGPIDVLVATDAVGMGLNLAIRRMVFSRLDKYDGTSQRPLSVSEMKQIAGRAGRFGSAFPVGVVTATRRQHLPTLAAALAAPTPPLRTAGVLPQLEQLELYAAALLDEATALAAAAAEEEDDDEGSSDSDADPDGDDADAVGSGRALVYDDAAIQYTTVVDADGNHHEVATSARRATASECSAAAAVAGLAAFYDDSTAPRTSTTFAAASSTRPSRLAAALSMQRMHSTTTTHAAASQPWDSGYLDDDDVNSMLLGPAAPADDASAGDTANAGEGDTGDDGDAADLGAWDEEALVDGRLRSRVGMRVRARADEALAALPFSSILQSFLGAATVNPALYHLCDARDTLAVARALDAVPGLSFRVRYAWSLAPVDVDDPLVGAALKRYARRFVDKGRVRVGLKLPSAPPRTPSELGELESAHAVYDLYLWLARRYPAEFVQAADAAEAAATVQRLIQKGLQAMGDAALAVVARRRAAHAAAAAAASASAGSRRDRRFYPYARPSGDYPERAEEEEDGDDDDDVFAGGAGRGRGSEYLRSMVVRDDEEDEGSASASDDDAVPGDLFETRAGNARRRHDRGSSGGDVDGSSPWVSSSSSRAAKQAAKAARRDKKAAARIARQAQRAASALVARAFADGGLGAVRSLAAHPLWAAALADGVPATVGGKRERALAQRRAGVRAALQQQQQQRRPTPAAWGGANNDDELVLPAGSAGPASAFAPPPPQQQQQRRHAAASR